LSTITRSNGGIDVLEFLEKPEMLSMRDAYGETLMKLGEMHKEIVVVGADTTASIKTSLFGQRFPERFFNVGIAEQNLVSVAAGLALAGKVAFASTYAVFTPGKCVDQIRNAIAYPNLNVKIVASHAGLSVGPDGASHQELEDIATMRAIPNVKVMVPSDYNSTVRLTQLISKTPGTFYMRIARPNCASVHTKETAEQIGIGKSVVMREGSDVTIIACGLLVYESLLAAKKLQIESGISAGVIDMSSIKPIDEQTIVRMARSTGHIITAEEHNILGGMGSAVAEVLSERSPVPLKRIGTRDTFGESGEHPELLEKYGLTARNIANAVVELTSSNPK
jgi:transketolase